MNCDIIITTYNRALRASETIQQFLDLPDHFFGHIIVVDSSDNLNQSDYPASSKVIYIKSSHKNQPYQRFLGYLASEAEMLLYLDDDMDLLEPASLTIELQRLNQSALAGINFSFRNDNAFLATMPKNITSNWNSKLGKAVKCFSGSPSVPVNKFSVCGLRGQRVGGQPIEYLQGGAFAAKRTCLYQNFNFHLFNLFEDHIGMGEDAILGFTLAQSGQIWASIGEAFYHNDQKNSAYTPNLFSYNRRVAYSRLYLSMEYARLKNINKALVVAHYHWYMLWRTFGILVTLCSKPSKSRLIALQGWLSGWGKTFFNELTSLDKSKEYWVRQARQDLAHAK